MVKPTNAQSIPKSSLPEFTIKFVNASYTLTTTNTFTGLTETKQISNDTIEITITNQPFDYSNYQIYYNVRSKPHFGTADNWTEVYPVMTGASSYNGGYNFSYAQYINEYAVPQSKSGNTIITFSVKPTDLYLGSGYDVIGYYGIPEGSQLDFQLEANFGHPSQRWISDHPLYPTAGGGFEPAIAYDTASEWSNTQTITIGETASTSPTPTPTVPELSWLAIVPLLLSLLSVAVVIRHRKQVKKL